MGLEAYSYVCETGISWVALHQKRCARHNCCQSERYAAMPLKSDCRHPGRASPETQHEEYNDDSYNDPSNVNPTGMQ
eukprot:scaffold624561_cov22-Prasinocladus_malaysianus.AAC.1